MSHDHHCFCCAPPTHAGTVRLEDKGKNPLETAPDESKSGLKLEDFKPRSMLHVPETRVPQPRFPVIDMHAHLTWTREIRSGVSVGEEITVFARPEDLLPIMDRKHIKTLVNLTGGTGKGLEQSIRTFDEAAPGRFLTLTEPSFGLFTEPDFARRQGEAIEHAHRVGARGLKLLKTLGLYLRENIDEGPLVAVDDKRFDSMWEACAAHDMPVFMHISDPEAFFLPIDASNERYEELAQHPDWSFYGPEYPDHKTLIEARDRVIARHPDTTFVLLHVGNNAENLAAVSACLDRYPNTLVDISARIAELGRQPRIAQRFFDKYQDRILFGTDAVPSPWGDDVPQQLFSDELYEIYYRFLETEDEYFDYAPAFKPPQGRWSIYGLKLSDTIVRKVYHDNSAYLFGIE
ncbi:MAG TPA: amidohydrolase family protein [Oleiagrimonas sp.]|nr:amidohydrolase family protein [Oleiagrimonas sp.]